MADAERVDLSFYAMAYRPIQFMAYAQYQLPRLAYYYI